MHNNANYRNKKQEIHNIYYRIFLPWGLIGFIIAYAIARTNF